MIRIVMFLPCCTQACEIKPKPLQNPFMDIWRSRKLIKCAFVWVIWRIFSNIIADIESVFLGLVEPYLPQIQLILSLPSIKDIFTAIAILAEIGPDMPVFPSSKHVYSWTGLTPQNNESAGKKKSVRVSRAGVYIKPLLVNVRMLQSKVNSVRTLKSVMTILRSAADIKKRL